jgi:hypothetical protein
MKYLRLFENKFVPHFYHISYGSDDLDLILACLEKITDDYNKKKLFKAIRNFIFNDVYIIFNDNEYYDIGFWLIRKENNGMDFREFNIFISNNKLENWGEVTLEDHEISATKYNL